MRRRARIGLERIEDALDRVFGPQANPMKNLGALGWYFYWIVIVSGIYLYVFFDTGISEAYRSVEYMTHDQWYAAGVMRSLHRYASDALVVVMLIHLVREYVKDRYRGVRWFAWVIGVVMIWLVYISGVSGYWLVWDQLAQYVAVATSEWLDALGIFGEPIVRNFLHDSTLGGRFFTLMIFIHIFVPLFLLFMMWFHTQRLAKARTNPPRLLAVGSMVMLLAVSFARPAVSQGPAELSSVPAEIGLDWFYLALYPLLDAWPKELVWMLVAGATVLLLATPWAPPRREAAAAEVDLDNCNGCARCFVDCPYSAIIMVPRTDDAPYEQQAEVNADWCVACGICVGACPTATPYRRRTALVPGIDLPELPLAAVRRKLLEDLTSHSGPDRLLVVGCKAGPDVEALAGDGVTTLTLPCIGALPPAFLDFVLSRHHADGILLAGCHENDCEARLGDRWTRERLGRVRDPHLRARVPDERFRVLWCGASGDRTLREAAAAFRRDLAQMPPRAAQPVREKARREVQDALED